MCKSIFSVICISAWYRGLYPQQSLLSAHHLLSFQPTFQDHSGIFMLAKVTTPLKGVCYFQSNIKSHWKLNAGFPGHSFFCLLPLFFFDWFGYFDKKIDCKERRGHDFSQPMVVIYAYDRHRGMRASCICSACNCSPNAQTNKKRCQQLREFYFILKHLLYTN